MSELKVNTIQPAAGNQVTVQAQVLGVPGTDPNHFATVSQLGGGGAGGISRAEAQELVDAGVAAANRHSDNQDELQTTQTNLDIAAAKQEAVGEAVLLANAYTDSRIGLLIEPFYQFSYSHTLSGYLYGPTGQGIGTVIGGTSIGSAYFSMPALNYQIIAPNLSGLTAQQEGKTLPPGIWALSTTVLGNIGPGSGEASDDDKFTYYGTIYQRVTSTINEPINIIDWLVNYANFGDYRTDGSGNLRNYRGHQAGVGMAVYCGPVGS